MIVTDKPLTTRDVAQLLGWTSDRTRRWARAGKLPGAIAIGDGRGRCYVFVTSVINAFAATLAAAKDSRAKDREVAP